MAERNEKKNKNESEINSLKRSLDKKENINERISFQEIGVRIIKFFSLTQPEKEIKEYEAKNGSPSNINVIIKHMKNNLGYYFGYMKKNNVDLTYVLKEISKENNNYNDLIYDKEINFNKFIELMNARDKNLGGKIKFIFNNSKYIYDYVFIKDNKIKEKEIYEEFEKKNKELGKKEGESKKKEEECKMNDECF